MRDFMRSLPGKPDDGVVAIGRRQLVLGGAALALPLAARAQSGEPIRIGQSTALTGALGDLGRAVHAGAKAAFDAANAEGGVNGRRIELVVADDAYEADRAVANVEAMLAERNLLMLFSCFGTPAVDAMLPKVMEAGIPFFAPYTGAVSARVKARNVFNIRASYPEEAERIVRYLATIGQQRVALAWQDNAFGREVEDGVRRAVERHELRLMASVAVSGDSSNAETAAEQLVDAGAQAVLLGLAGRAALETIRALRAKSNGLALYGLSVLGAAGTLNSLGDDGQGLMISQVMPPPDSQPLAISRAFQRDWKTARMGEEPSYVAMEGYVNARVAIEAMRRAGPGLSRQSFIDSVWGLRRVDLGGFWINFTEPGANASGHVELTMVGKAGRYIR